MTVLKYACPKCSHECATQHFMSHMLKNHEDFFKQSKYAMAMRCGVKGSLPIIHLSDTKPIKCCFGCNKFWAKFAMADAHKDECLNKDKHREICAKFCENKTEDTETIVSDDVQVKMSNLEKENKELLKKMRMMEAQMEKMKKEQGKFVYGFAAVCDAIGNVLEEEQRIEIIKSIDRSDEDDETKKYKINWYNEFACEEPSSDDENDDENEEDEELDDEPQKKKSSPLDYFNMGCCDHCGKRYDPRSDKGSTPWKCSICAEKQRDGTLYDDE